MKKMNTLAAAVFATTLFSTAAMAQDTSALVAQYQAAIASGTTPAQFLASMPVDQLEAAIAVAIAQVGDDPAALETLLAEVQALNPALAEAVLAAAIQAAGTNEAAVTATIQAAVNAGMDIDTITTVAIASGANPATITAATNAATAAGEGAGTGSVSAPGGAGFGGGSGGGGGTASGN